MVKSKRDPQGVETDGVKKTLLVSVALFLLVTCVIALLQWLPWSAPLAVVEIPVNYLPQWLPLLLLSPFLLFWRRVVSLSKLQLCLVGLGIIYILFQHMDFGLPLTNASQDSEDASLRVLTANLAQVDAAKFSALLRFQKPDVIVTQEMHKPELTALLAKLLNPATVDSGRNPASGALSSEHSGPNGDDLAWRLHCEHKLCLASRFPFSFVEGQSRRFRGAWGAMGAAYDLKVNGEPLRVFNVHLETVRKGFENISLSRTALDSILQNAHNRRTEAELLSSWIGEQRPVVVVGDFNMTSRESLYREYFGQFRNAFSQVGFGLGHTKSTRLLGVRIDHLLTTADVLPVAARVGIDVGSDHRPLLVDLALGR